MARWAVTTFQGNFLLLADSDIDDLSHRALFTTTQEMGLRSDYRSPGRFLSHIAWNPTSFVFDAPGVPASGSYQFEFVAPNGMVISGGELFGATYSQPETLPFGRSDSQGPVLAASSRVDEVPDADTYAVEVRVRPSSGLLRSCAVTATYATLLLLLAAGLRLGVLPLHLSYTTESHVRRGFSATLTLVSAASSLVLLVHIPAQSLGSIPLLVLLGLTSAAALFGGWMFLRAPDDLAGRPFWIIGLAALSVAAALFGNPAGAAAWGCVLVLAGGALFLSSMQRPWLNRILLIGVWSLSGLPFSLGASGWGTASNGLWLLPFLIGGQALLMAGFIRHALRSPIRQPFESLEIWAQKIYPIGILLLLAAQLMLGVWGWDGALQFGLLPAALGATGLAMLLFWAMPRFAFLNPVRAHWVRPAPAPWLDGLYRGLGGAYRRLTQVSQAITDILEGDGGIMWTLLFLVLFISLFSQARR